MDPSLIIMWVGFLLAGYSVIGNDSIQTLGTFISSNEERPWYVLWIFAGGILTATMIYGWYNTDSERLQLYEKTFIADTTTFENYAVKVHGREDLFFSYQELKAELDNLLIFPSSFKKLSPDNIQKLREADFTSVDVFAPKDDETLQKTGVADVRPAGLFQLEIRLDDGSSQKLVLENRQVRDVSYNRLEKYDVPFGMPWYYMLPPLVLLFLTRTGIPVSTSFLVLTFFNEKNLQDMVLKSVSGYAVAFVSAIAIYLIITTIVEKRFIENPITPRERRIWVPLQWLSTGFLWSQWLIQDFANIYAYLPRDVDSLTLAVSLVALLLLLAYIFYQKGGAIQQIVKAKTNTVDLRSATLVDATYGAVLFYFSNINTVPMSTTWVFIGLLAGREIAIRLRLEKKVKAPIIRMVFLDLGKVLLGLAVSILLVFLIKWISSGTVEMPG